jgi:preprotein translocase subunit SecD
VALVFVYALAYYRLLGLVMIASLVLSAIVVYASLVLLGRQIGFTLSLAGIAGFIVSIGITADSFVVLFERLKDEIREGRTLRSAVPRAWVRARRTILSADAVSFLAAAILYVLAIGDVKGFAFTLGLSTVLDLVVVFLFTHPLLSVLARFPSFGTSRFSGLGRVDRAGHGSRPSGPAERGLVGAGTSGSRTQDRSRA